MKNLKCLFGLIFMLVAALFTAAGQEIQLLDKKVNLPGHPRLLLLKDQENGIKANIEADTYWKKIHQYVIQDCEAIMNLQPVENVKIGRRLLDKARECIRRVFYLAYSYRLTRDEKYLKRAEKEMLAVAAFSDWNPSHFLDVGEMTTALAIGYDWLYNDLSESTRVAIREAILKKGIEPSLDDKYNSWVRVTNNWNQVCNTGIAFGALVTYEDHPELSRKIIERAITTIELPMRQYAPDGAYPEGYAYWGYGTTYNVMFISALETAFGNDFDLTKKPGFINTASYQEHMTGPSGQHFNYADCGSGIEFNPAMIWFAGKPAGTSLLWVEKQKLSKNLKSGNRFLPVAMVWGKGIQISKSPAPKTLMWVGNGVNPVALFRTSWTDAKAVFVGFKGGSPSVSHAHMDVGSFIMEADGVRWGMDLGMQEYESMESKGIDLWNMKQNSTRWKMFRYNNLAHNTITINNEFQDVNGKAPLTSHSASPVFMNAQADLTALYKNISSLIRGIAIVDKKYVLVRDEITTGADSITFRWSMVTPASVEIINSNQAALTKDGKKLLLNVEGPAGIVMKTWSTAPTTNVDAPNPDTRIVGYEVRLPPESKYAINVWLVPQQAVAKFAKKAKSLSDWPK